MGIMLALDRKIPDGVADLRTGKWDKKRYSRAQGLWGRTLGLVGVGAIGAAVGVRAKAFGMRVVGYSRQFDSARANSLGFERAESLLALARQVDVLSVHVPAGASTKKMISAEVLAALRSQAMFINTSRADVVDEAALLAEVKAERLWVGTDVFGNEPKGGQADFTSELSTSPRVYGSHHIGASTEQAQEAIADETIRILERFLTEGVVANCVNVAEQTPARFQLIVRHYDKVGVLANVLNEIREAGINAQEIENTVFSGAAAACCKIQLDSRPGDEVLNRIRARKNEIIFVDGVELSA
jgi:D-3-phosphoglycerate dehydrogenase